MGDLSEPACVPTAMRPGNPAQRVLRILLDHGITEATGGSVDLVEALATEIIAAEGRDATVPAV